MSIDWKNLKGSVTVTIDGVVSNVSVDADFDTHCLLIMSAITSLYQRMKSCVKDDVVEPEKEIRKCLVELIDLAIENGQLHELADNVLESDDFDELGEDKFMVAMSAVIKQALQRKAEAERSELH